MKSMTDNEGADATARGFLTRLRSAVVCCFVALALVGGGGVQTANAAYEEICLRIDSAGYVGALRAYWTDASGNRLGGYSSVIGNQNAHTNTCVSGSRISPGSRVQFAVRASGFWEYFTEYCGAHPDNKDKHPGFWLMPDGPAHGKLIIKAGAGTARYFDCSQYNTELQMHSMCNNSYGGMLIGGCQPFVPDSRPTDSLHWAIRQDQGLGFLGAYARDGANPDAAALDAESFGRGNTPLHIAAWLNRPAYARALIDDAGAAVDSRSGGGETPLWFAFSRNHQGRIARDLLERGADPDVEIGGERPVLLAAREGRNDLLELLAAHGADLDFAAGDGDFPLYIAAAGDNAAGAEFLVEGGADLDKRHRNGKTAVMVARLEGSADALAYLRSVGAREDVYDGMIYDIVAERRGARLARDSLRRGADVNYAGAEGRTALHLAADAGLRDYTLALARGRGLEIDAKDAKGRTALMTALVSDNYSPEILRELVARGASPNATDAAGDFPLYTAIEQGRGEIVRLLSAARDVDLDACHSEDGVTPRGRAEKLAREDRGRYWDIYQFLVRRGAAATVAGCGEGVYDSVVYDAVAERRGPLAIREALRNGAKVNYPGPGGRTALHVAAAEGLNDYALALARERGLDLNARDFDGRTPLMTALLADDVSMDILRTLISREADGGIADNEGDFPVWVAVESGRRDLLRLVAAARGVDLSQCHREEGKTALGRARELVGREEERFWGVFQFLVRRGAGEECDEGEGAVGS